MNPIEFLQQQLKEISKSFPNVHIKYAFNSVIATHIVELLPLSEYQNNDALDDAWIPLSFQFRQQFPEEEISFVSSDSSLSIESSTFEFNKPSIQCFGDISAIYSQISQVEINYTFPKHMPIGAIAIGASIDAVLKSPKQDIEKETDNNYYQAAA